MYMIIMNVSKLLNSQVLVSEDLQSLHIPTKKFVLGLQYLFDLPDKKIHRRAIHVQCPKNIFRGIRGPPLKGKRGEVIEWDEGMGEGKALGRRSGIRGRDGGKGRVWKVRGEEGLEGRNMGRGVLLHASGV